MSRRAGQFLKIVIGMFALTELTASIAAAQPGGYRPRPAEGETTSVWLETTFFTGSGTIDGYTADGTLVAPTLGTIYRPGPRFELETRFGIAHAWLGGVDTKLGRIDLGDSLRAGNAYLGGHYLVEDGGVFMRTGLGVSFPTASNDDGLDKANLFATMGTQGLWDAYMWPEDLMALVIPFRLELGRGSPIFLAWDLGVAGLLKTAGQGSRIGLAAQGASEVNVEVTSGLYARARLALAWLVGKGDNFQIAIEPGLTYDIGAFRIGGRLTINLDDPYGFAFDAHRQWGAHLLLGGRL